MDNPFLIRSRKRRESILSPEEEDSLLDEILGGAGSALGTVGNILDTPGAFVRNILAGRNPLPGIFDTDERISGRELLEHHGVIDRNTAGFDMGDVAGFGAEVLTDPFILVSGGTTKAGAIAKDLGKFPKRSVFSKTGALELGKRTARRNTLGSVLEGADDVTMELARAGAAKRGTTLDALIDEPMQRSLGFGLPFQENFATLDLPGASGRAALADKIGGLARQSWPGRQMARLFDADVLSSNTMVGQETAKRVREQVAPEKAAAEAAILRMHQDLEAVGVMDHDVRANLLERFHPDAPNRTLSPEETVYRNLPRLDGEDVATYEARTKPAVEVIKRQMSTLDKEFDADVEWGIRTGYEKADYGYNPRQATWPEYGRANWWKKRSKDIGELPRTQIDAILLDPKVNDLAKRLYENPLSAEALSRPISKRVMEELGNLGYEDLDDIVDWQADVMRTKTFGSPDFHRTAAHTPRIDQQVQNELREHILTTHLGVPKEDWMSLGKWQEEASELADLRKELKEVDTAVPGIDAQIADATEQLRQAEGDLVAYRDGKARLDMRDIFSRERDEYFDIDRLTDQQKQDIQYLQEIAAKATPSLRERHRINATLAEKQLNAAAKAGQKTDILEARVEDVTTKPRLSRKVRRESERNEAVIAGHLRAGSDLEAQAADIKKIIDDADTAAAELQALEAQYRAGGYFVKNPSEYLADKEIKQLAALRASADRAGYLRSKIKRLEDRRASGNFQPNPAEQIDEINDHIGRAEVAQANLRAMNLMVTQADALIERAKDVPAEALEGKKRFFGNDVLHDLSDKVTRGLDRRAMVQQIHDTLAANLSVGEQALQATEEMVPYGQALDELGISVGNVTKRSQAIRKTAQLGKKHGTIADDVFENIAGPHAVATSGLRNDVRAAQAMRDAEIAEVQQAVAAGLIDRASGAARVAELAQLPLPDVSAVGNIKRAREAYANTARGDADAALANGLISQEDHATLLGQIESFRKGTGSLGPEADKLMAAVHADNPIPNDGLLQVRNWYVPREVVDAMKGIKEFRFPKSEKGTLGHFLDDWRQITKAHFTLPWPAFHSRNVQGMAMFYASLGVKDPRYGAVRGILQPVKDMANVLAGKGIKDADTIPYLKAMGLKGADAERQLVADLSAHGALHGAGDLIGTEAIEPTFFGRNKEHQWGTTPEQFGANIPGGQPTDASYFLSPLRKAKQRIKEAPKKGRAIASELNPLNVEKFIPTAVGAKLSNYLENLGRGAAMIGMLRQGKSVEQAAAMMKAAFVDYEQLSRFERTILRRVIPFYSFMRRSIPYTLGQFIEKPGGLYGQSARLANVARQESGFQPPQLGGSLAIPIGEEEDGVQRYLSQIDLPSEAINKLLVPGQSLVSQKTVSNTARSLLAQADPLLKGFIELGTGKSTFQGRNIEDLDPLLGRIAGGIVGSDKPLFGSSLADQAVANSPLARYFSTARTMLDDRKSIPDKVLNLSSGTRLTDIDMPKAKGIAASNIIKELLKNKGARESVQVNFSKEEIAALPADQRADAIRLQALLNSLRRDAKKEREKAK